MKKNEIINQIITAFEKKYFKDVRVTSWWVNDEIDTVFYINDFWLGTEDMLFCICNNISVKRFLKAYEQFENNMPSPPDYIGKEIKPLIEFLK